MVLGAVPDRRTGPEGNAIGRLGSISRPLERYAESWPTSTPKPQDVVVVLWHGALHVVVWPIHTRIAFIHAWEAFVHRLGGVVHRFVHRWMWVVHGSSTGTAMVHLF